MNQHILKLRTLLLSNKFYYILFTITLIFALIITNYIKFNSKYKGYETKFNGVITSYVIDGNKLTFEFKTKEKFIGSYYFDTYKELINFKNNIKLGDTLKIIGVLEESKKNSIPNIFNYKKYLYNNKIFYILKVEEYYKIKDNSNIFYNIKNIIIKRIEKIKHNEYVYAFILGETYYINEEINDSYRTNGITHLFALSGSNVALFAVLLNFILKKIKLNEFTIHILIFIFLMLVNFITGFAPSMLRASVFFFLYGINKIFSFFIKTINILLLTFIVLVLFNPFIICDIGFQFSFIITFFLILSGDLINNKNFLLNLLLVSLIAFISSIPITIYNFYYINFMSVINNIFYVPYVSFIVFPCSIIVFIFPFFNKLLFFVAFIMENISLFLNEITLLYISFPKVSLVVIIIYYLFLILYIKSKRKIFLISNFLILIICYLIPYINKNTYIYFLDVGQGDATLITTHLKKSILIDTGGIIKYKEEEWKKRNKSYSLVKQNMIPFFNSLGISKIDYLILTHGDFDHMGEAINLVNNFKVVNVIFNCGTYNYLERELIKVLEEKNIKYYSCINELNIDKYKLYFLNTREYDNENDNSNVIYFNYYNYKFLFMGDAGKEKEKEILTKYHLRDIDFLKVGHHGSNTSSSEEFIKSIDPKYSIISIGKNNRYGHPKDNVLDTLKNSKIYRTDKDGSIEIKLNKNVYSVTTYRP